MKLMEKYSGELLNVKNINRRKNNRSFLNTNFQYFLGFFPNSLSVSMADLNIKNPVNCIGMKLDDLKTKATFSDLLFPIFVP